MLTVVVTSFVIVLKQFFILAAKKPRGTESKSPGKSKVVKQTKAK
jgi:hypothetical protein